VSLQSDSNNIILQGVKKMAKKIGTSNVPMIMGIIGGAGLVFAALFGAGSFGAACMGFVGGMAGKKMPIFAGILMLLAGLVSGMMIFIVINDRLPIDETAMLVVLPNLPFLLGGIFCFIQKKEDAPDKTLASQDSGVNDTEDKG
jgi:hypothetical protein